VSHHVDWLTDRSSVEGDQLVVHLAGELDLASTVSVADACTHGLHRSVRVDLRDLTFMDCAGYSGLVTARNLLTSRGSTFVLLHADGEPARLLATLEAVSTANGQVSMQGQLPDAPLGPREEEVS